MSSNGSTAKVVVVATLTLALRAAPSSAASVANGAVPIPDDAEPYVPAAVESTCPPSATPLGTATTPRYTREDFTVLSFDCTPLDVSLYVPVTTQPANGWPMIVLAHGGGSDKDQVVDAARAKHQAADGFLTLAFSARGHGKSGGLVSVVGPNEVRDLKQLLDWVLSLGDPRVDPAAIGMTGYSQGGIYSWLGAAYDDRIEAIAPGITGTDLLQALIPHGVVKLSLGVGLLATYYAQPNGPRQGDVLPPPFPSLIVGHVDPVVLRWVAAASTGIVGTSDFEADLAWRSAKSYLDVYNAAADPAVPVESIPGLAPAPRTTPLPVFLMEAWEDTLFPPQQQTTMFEKLVGPKKLYLGPEGHVAPSVPPTAECDPTTHEPYDQCFPEDAYRQGIIEQWFDHWLRGNNNGVLDHTVTYKIRDPSTGVWSDPINVDRWPIADSTLTLYLVSGRLAGAPGDEGASVIANTYATQGENDDPVTTSVVAGPLPVPYGEIPGHTPADTALFDSDPLAADLTIVGIPSATLFSTSSATDYQLDVKLYDVDPSGTETLVTRGYYAERSGIPGVLRRTAGYDVFGAAHRFLAAHRVRLAVSSHDTPFALPEREPALTAIFTGSDRASRIELPIRAR